MDIFKPGTDDEQLYNKTVIHAENYHGACYFTFL